jgi:excisionase family DNA binding protein
MKPPAKLHEGRRPSQESAPNDTHDSIPKRLLSKKQLAGLLGVSPRTIETWLSEKRIPQLRLSARLTRFSLPRVEAALARYEIKEIGERR